ncbi:hypothetical protein, partial [Pseudomonas aeruginosa]|uniref:hypothetical protein n=1 Tax=Pseudomonas aeruginosa TaxID=287 RepID=UPI0039844290
AVCTLRFFASPICCHPFEDDSLNYPVVTVSKGGSTIGVKFGSASGNGFLLGQKGSYRYTVEDNLPRKPATLETLFGMFDAQLAPGELTSEVRMAILAVGGEDALQWWTELGEHERYRWLNKPGIDTPIDAWQEFKRQQGH